MPQSCLGCNVTDELAQSGCIHGSHLFDQNAGDLSFDIDLRSEGGWSRPSGGWGYQDDGSRQQFIGLHDDTKAPALLLVPPSWWRAKNMDITPEHAGSP
jgi:hypothetical protein